MVAVAAHHVGHVALNPFFEEVERAVVAGLAAVPALQPLALGELPLVAGLVHDEQAQLVAKVIDDGCLRIVAHADGVHANLLQLFQAVLPHLRRHDCAQHAGIVVQADALHLHPLAVEGKAVVGVELQRAQSGAHHGAVHRLVRVVACAEPCLYII